MWGISWNETEDKQTIHQHCTFFRCAYHDFYDCGVLFTVKKQVFSDLAVVANILIDEGSYERKIDNLRITLIDADGKVLFDSSVDGQSLANHLDRPEIVEAISSEVGMGIRKSGTLSENVFYYAKNWIMGRYSEWERRRTALWLFFCLPFQWC